MRGLGLKMKACTPSHHLLELNETNSILQNIALIKSIEVTKTTFMEIQKQQLEATKTEQTRHDA
jgi:hypothetical protein